MLAEREAYLRQVLSDHVPSRIPGQCRCGFRWRTCWQRLEAWRELVLAGVLQADGGF